jgi:hypothetical protein
MALVTTVSMLLAMLWYFYSNDECTARTAITIRPVVLKPKLLCGHALKMLKHQGAVASVLERSGDSYETTEHLELVLDDARDIAERLGIDLHQSILNKIDANGIKYPIGPNRGKDLRGDGQIVKRKKLDMNHVIVGLEEGQSNHLGFMDTYEGEDKFYEKYMRKWTKRAVEWNVRRGWAKYLNKYDMVMALAREVGELTQALSWFGEDEEGNDRHEQDYVFSISEVAAIGEEVVDVVIYAVQLRHVVVGGCNEDFPDWWEDTEP